jgi:hypothetical protein
MRLPAGESWNLTVDPAPLKFSSRRGLEQLVCDELLLQQYRAYAVSPSASVSETRITFEGLS